MVLSDIRRQAREDLSGKWQKGVLITLVYFAFEFILGYISGLVKDIAILDFVIGVATLIISIPIAYGLIISFMKLKRGEEVKCYDFFTLGFSNFARSWKLAGNMLLKLLLPILLYVLAMFVLGFAISFSATTVILADVSAAAVFISIVGIILAIAAFVYLFISTLSYTLTYMIAYDNEEMEAKDVVEESKKLMTGNRANYVLLQLSFIGWAILTVFTLYIGVLWLVPYMQVAMICFYEALKENKVEE